MSDPFKVFLTWVLEELNPARVANGIEAVTEEEAAECWGIIKAFSLKLQGDKPK